MTQRLGVGSREVRAQDVPRVAGVGRPPKPVGRHIQHILVDRRKDNGERPLPTLDHFAGWLTRVEPRIGGHLAGRIKRSVVFVDVAAIVGTGVEDIQVLRVRCDVTGLTTSCTIRNIHRALSEIELPGIPSRREAQRAVVLLRSTNMERYMVCRDPVVELSC